MAPSLLVFLAMKRILIVFAAALLIATAAAWRFIAVPLKLVRVLDRRYQNVQPGMDSNQVANIMSVRGHWRTQYLVGYWDDVPLEPAQANQIRGALRYTVPTFFLPVTFEFTFDDGGKVIGRHRYD
jgi:hypothetical protein